MPKITPQYELDHLVDLIAAYPDGIQIEPLLELLSGQYQRRSLQRRLADLVEQGRVRMTGSARAVRYVCQPAQSFAIDLAQVPEKFYVNTSKAGEEIRAYVRQPRQRRKPVGYQLAFLEQYHPNQTFYLSQALRGQLHEIGRSPAVHAPAGTFARDMLNRLLIDLSWTSSQLEGNTYSLLDTERLIQFGQAAEGKDALETQMILNHKNAIEYLVRDPDHAALCPETLIALHALLSDGLLADPTGCGRIRNHAVGIGGSVYMPFAFPQQLDELFGIAIRMAAEIQNPFEQAFFLMVHIPYLQPFGDVNKRVSRLAVNIPFIRHNLCPLSFIDVPQQDYMDALLGVYELNRVELLRDVFVAAYQRSCQQYVVVQNNLVPPDTFRLRYRQELTTVIAAIIRSDIAATEPAIRANLPGGVDQGDRTHFIRLVIEEFKSLHAGNAIRFGIRALEFSGWHDKHGK